ncbi:nucleotide sugar dehydrogenase [Candidatus Dependentiae bacterium]|nr:nucleotide sugar dehydrogenase [Candidatus Dependentiae bacterium]
MKRIAVLGLGYIGLPTAILAAECGYTVFGFDVDEQKVQRLNTGDTTIIEPEITDRLTNALKNKNLLISISLHYADCFIIAVPTPIKSNNTADLSFVMSAADHIAKRIMPGNLVLLESTVPVGITEQISQRIAELSGLQAEVDFFTAHCPERVLPGKIFKELVDNDRVVGGCSQKSCELAKTFYSKFVRGFIYITNDKVAEMVKLVENSSRDVQLAFANQVSSMCNAAGIDTYQVIELANRHPRVNILSPTCGVGGHCIAVDPWFLVESFPQETLLLKTAREINDQKPHQVLAKIVEQITLFKESSNTTPTVLALGVTFKPDVDDLRESPALKIVLELLKKTSSTNLLVYDPCAPTEDLEKLKLPYIQDFNFGLEQADIVVALVKHKFFIHNNEPNSFDNKILIDTCGLMHEITKQNARDKLKGALKSGNPYETATF